MSINIPNESIKYYTGLIRQLESDNTILKQRIKNLEERVSKLAHVSGGDSIDGLVQAVSTAASATIPTSTGGLNSTEIKSLITSWIKDGLLPIQKHDHTDDAKGGDAYANKGVALQ